MEESRTQRLQELLRRLGKAVHGSVVRSEEVRTCLDELHNEGWRAVMLLETSLACGESGLVEVDSGTLRMHVDTTDPAVPGANGEKPDPNPVARMLAKRVLRRECGIARS